MEEGLSLEGVLIVRDLPRVSPSDYSSKWYDGTSEGSWVMYSDLRMLPLEGECSMWRRDSHSRERLLSIQMWV